ncbi:hypothetical protein RF55_25435, partial [Lasius niger]
MSLKIKFNSFFDNRNSIPPAIVNTPNVNIEVPQAKTTPKSIYATLTKKKTLPPFSENIVMLKVNSAIAPGSELIAEQSFSSLPHVLVSSSVNTVDPQGLIVVKIGNFSNDPVTLNKGMKIVTLQNCPPQLPVNSVDYPSDQEGPDLAQMESFEVWGGELDLSHLEEDQKLQLTELLNKYPKLFAKSVLDLEGCDTLLHRIQLTDDKP